MAHRNDLFEHTSFNTLPSTIQNDDEWLSTGGVAKLTDYSTSYYEKMRVRGRTDGPPWYKINGRIRYRKSDVIVWLEEFRVQREESK